jgi:hypothetical protein
MERKKEYVHGKESFSVWYKFGYRKGLLSMYVLLAFLNFLQSNDKFSVPACAEPHFIFPRTPLGGRTLHTRKAKVTHG